MLLLLVVPWFILNFVSWSAACVFQMLAPFPCLCTQSTFLWFCHTDKTAITFLLAVVKRTRRGCSKHRGRKRRKHKWTTLMPAQHHYLSHQRRQAAMTCNCLLPNRSQFADARTPPRPQGEGFDVGRFPHLSSCLLNQQKSPMGSKVFTIILTWCSGTGVLAFIGTHWKWFPARLSVSFWIFGGLFISSEERVYASGTGITDIKSCAGTCNIS